MLQEVFRENVVAQCAGGSVREWPCLQMWHRRGSSLCLPYCLPVFSQRFWPLHPALFSSPGRQVRGSDIVKQNRNSATESQVCCVLDSVLPSLVMWSWAHCLPFPKLKNKGLLYIKSLQAGDLRMTEWKDSRALQSRSSFKNRVPWKAIGLGDCWVLPRPGSLWFCEKSLFYKPVHVGSRARREPRSGYSLGQWNVVVPVQALCNKNQGKIKPLSSGKW